MIKQAQFNLCLTVSELRTLISLKGWKGKHWDKPIVVVKPIKDKIRSQLKAVQTHCSYCGLKLGGTSTGEVEHIAPKGKNGYPQFTFTLKNLTFSCSYCNGVMKKHTKNTIKMLKKTYSKCEFLIVHPYFDDPSEHYEWTDSRVEVLIQIKNNSVKAENSIKMFGLDTLHMNELRAAQIRYEELKVSMSLSQKDEELLHNVVKYNCSKKIIF